MALNYDDLTESQKRKLKEIAVSMGYKIEGTTDDDSKSTLKSVLFDPRIRTGTQP